MHNHLGNSTAQTSTSLNAPESHISCMARACDTNLNEMVSTPPTSTTTNSCPFFPYRNTHVGTGASVDFMQNFAGALQQNPTTIIGPPVLPNHPATAPVQQPFQAQFVNNSLNTKLTPELVTLLQHLIGNQTLVQFVPQSIQQTEEKPKQKPKVDPNSPFRHHPENLPYRNPDACLLEDIALMHLLRSMEHSRSAKSAENTDNNGDTAETTANNQVNNNNNSNNNNNNNALPLNVFTRILDEVLLTSQL